MQTSTERMIARKEGAIGWMVFNNPDRHNAVSVEMWRAVTEIMQAFERDEAIRAIVLAGAGGKAFISGADISEFEHKRASREAVLEYNAIAERANLAIAEASKPTLAMIKGFCIGGGLAVALCCDLRFASTNSRFGVPAAKLGLGYGFAGFKRLADLVGPAYAKEIFYTARQFDAAEALEMRLVNRLRPAEELERYVEGYATMIAANAPLTVATVKLCAKEYAKDPHERDLAKCQAAVDQCFASADYIEGRTAFMEKRKPAFLGR